MKTGHHYFEEETYLFLKRLLDIGLTVIAAPLVGGVIVVCAILLKIESPKASVFFLQERTGKDGKRFKMYKFRTMVKAVSYTHLTLPTILLV